MLKGIIFAGIVEQRGGYSNSEFISFYSIEMSSKPAIVDSIIEHSYKYIVSLLITLSVAEVCLFDVKVLPNLIMLE